MIAAYLLTQRRLPQRHRGAVHRHDRGGDRRLSRRADRAAAHRHLLRHDHGGDRRGVLLRRVQSARPPSPAARTAYPACRRRRFDLGFTTIRFDSDWSLYGFLAVLVFRRHRDRAAHRALAGRRHPQRHPRQPAARRGGRPQHPRLQARRLRHRRGLCRLRRRAARRDAGLHAARRLHLRHLRPARDADGDRRHRHAVRPAGRRRASGSISATSCRPRSHLGAAWKLVLGRRLRAAGLLPAPRPRSAAQISPPSMARRMARRADDAQAASGDAARGAPARAVAGRAPCRRAGRATAAASGPMLEATGLDQALRRPARQQRHRLLRQARRAPRHHRPERRRQDHLLQDADLRSAARPPARSSSRAATSPASTSPTSASSA